MSRRDIKKIRVFTFAGVLAVAFLFLAGLFIAQPAPQQGRYPEAQNPEVPTYPNGQPNTLATPTAAVVNDNEFARNAAEGGMAEVKLGELAEQKGSSDTVKNFGKQMVTDHSAANEKLKDIASQQNLQLPTALSKHDERVYDKLSKLSGAAFDRAYAKDMVDDHEQDISDFKTEANGGQNAAVKNFASATLPTLEDHLKMAREMEQQVKRGE